MKGCQDLPPLGRSGAQACMGTEGRQVGRCLALASGGQHSTRPVRWRARARAFDIATCRTRAPLAASCASNPRSSSAPPPLVPPQWFVLNRKHVELILQDRKVERVFQQHCHTTFEEDRGEERVCYAGGRRPAAGRSRVSPLQPMLPAGCLQPCPPLAMEQPPSLPCFAHETGGRLSMQPRPPCPVLVADEHYFPTLLAVHGLDHETDCQGRFMGEPPGREGAQQCTLLGPGARACSCRGAAGGSLPASVLAGEPTAPRPALRLPQMWTGRAWRARRRTPGSTSQVGQLICFHTGLWLPPAKQRQS